MMGTCGGLWVGGANIIIGFLVGAVIMISVRALAAAVAAFWEWISPYLQLENGRLRKRLGGGDE